LQVLFFAAETKLNSISITQKIHESNSSVSAGIDAAASDTHLSWQHNNKGGQGRTNYVGRRF